MKIDVNVGYTNRTLVFAEIQVWLNEELAFRGSINGFDSFVQHLIQKLVSGGIVDTIFYKSNEQNEAILLRIESGNITLAIVDDESAYSELPMISQESGAFLCISEKLANMMPIYSNITLPYANAIFMLLNLVDKYVLDWEQHAEDYHLDDISSMLDFIYKYRKIKYELYLRCASLTENVEVTISSVLSAERGSHIAFGRERRAAINRGRGAVDFGGDNIFEQLPLLPELFNAFIIYFKNSSEDLLVDEEIAKKAVYQISPLGRSRMIEQYKILLSRPVLVWEEIQQATSRHFENEHAARQWVARMMAAAEDTDVRVGPYFRNSITTEMWRLLEAQKLTYYSYLYEFLEGYRRVRFRQYSDETTAVHYAQNVAPAVLAGVVKEIKLALNRVDLPWEEVNKKANMYFPQSEDFREWLKKIVQILEEISLRQG